jgi:hypothetical protein
MFQKASFENWSWSYVTTDGQWTSLSLYWGSICGPWPHFISVRQLPVSWFWAPYPMRGWVSTSQLLLGLVSAVILGSESHMTQDHTLLSQIWDCPNLEDQVPIFIFQRNRVTWLYPQALGSFFLAFHDSQGSGAANWSSFTGGLRLKFVYVMYRSSVLISKETSK